jgi:hypothetical protein
VTPLAHGPRAGLTCPAIVQSRPVKPATIDIHAHDFPESFFRVVDEAGAVAELDRVRLGSDYCSDTGYARPVDAVTRHAKLNRADQRRILGATAARLLRLG